VRQQHALSLSWLWDMEHTLVLSFNRVNVFEVFETSNCQQKNGLLRAAGTTVVAPITVVLLPAL
jgi:hypothetical protein